MVICNKRLHTASLSIMRKATHDCVDAIIGGRRRDAWLSFLGAIGCALLHVATADAGDNSGGARPMASGPRPMASIDWPAWMLYKNQRGKA